MIPTEREMLDHAGAQDRVLSGLLDGLPHGDSDAATDDFQPVAGVAKMISASA